MTFILALGLTWLLVGTAVAIVIGRGIRLADLRSTADAALYRPLLDRDRVPVRVPGAGFDRIARTV